MHDQIQADIRALLEDRDGPVDSNLIKGAVDGDPADVQTVLGAMEQRGDIDLYHMGPNTSPQYTLTDPS